MAGKVDPIADIEVIDTDAEGRLILADGLSYVIRNYRPDIVIDLATLGS